MKTFWDELALPARLQLSSSEIEEAFRKQSSEAHPDGGGAAGDFEKIREARNALLDPASRLTNWLQLHGIEPTHSGAISDEVAIMFTRVGEVTSGVDRWSEKCTTMTSGLGKALSQKEGFQWKEQVEALQEEVSVWQRKLEDRFPELALGAESNDFRQAVAIRNELGFLRKWQRELQVRFGKIWEGLI